MKIKFIFAIFTLFMLAACHRNEGEARREVPIRIVYPPELAPLMNAVGAELRSENPPTSTAINLEQTSEYPINAANKISTGEMKIEAWISPLMSLVDYTNSRIINLGAKQANCKKIFETPAVIATQDVFVENFKDKGGVFPWNDFIDLTDSAANQNTQNYLVSFGVGHHETTAGGLAALLQLIYLAQPVKSPVISPDNFKSNEFVARFQKYLGKVGEYAAKDEILFTKAAAVQDHLFFVISTEQQLINYNKTKPPGAKSLYALYPQEGSVWLDYNLCMSDADWVSPVQKGAIKELTELILKKTWQKNIINYGFRSALPDVKEDEYSSFPQFGAVTNIPHSNPRPELGEGVLKYIFNNSSKLKRPFAAMYILDTSGSTESGNTLSAGKRMMRALLAGDGPNDLSGLMAFSEEPTLLAPFSNDHGAKIKLLDVQQGTGGSAVYDAVADSIRAITKDELQGYRKIIYLFTDGNDNRSKMSLGTLLDLIRETRRHNDISLEVVALQGDNVDLSDIEKITKAFNGNMYKTSVADIDKVVAELSGAY
jgi:hypothetical protein